MLPASLERDFRAVQTAVTYQGQRETCAVFAATAAHEWMAGNRPDLSEEDALWSAKQVDGLPGEATWVSCALDGIRRNGQALTTEWPYGNPLYFDGPPPALDPDARRRCGPVRKCAESTVSDIAQIIADGHAAVVTVAFVPATWAAATSDGWVDDPAPPVRGGHAILVVGSVAASGARPDALIFKNSWSEAWGDAGYGFITDRYLSLHHQYTDILEVSP